MFFVRDNKDAKPKETFSTYFFIFLLPYLLKVRMLAKKKLRQVYGEGILTVR